MELFIPTTNQTCRLPDLPKSLANHVLETVGGSPVICGGDFGDSTLDFYSSCMHFYPPSAGGSWTTYATLMEKRAVHTSWVSSSGLFLFGGYDPNWIEIDNAELVSPGSSGGTVMDLKHMTK